ncbi:hypothetical protein KQI85_09380 [Falcatimonas sp. MSJ-15]|uniref:heme-binding Shp domain-containing protein n=1 Tax=Falcatimonas sp. MSJ-15 TaxID=2841515 RepID=UPI001C10AB72|nr:heme-binding Shp domain-containing protein [Falcatimonas sp. MSJ-15]MBU5470585.1 hypothetical protein [Falcatimonas sp. MSJ-15]
MKKSRKIRKLIACVIVLCITIGMGLTENIGNYNNIMSVYAAVKCETATLSITYRHPRTGTIEDSGGEAGEAIGQGMVANVLLSPALVETDSAGNVYMTVRMAMMDNITDVNFAVQKNGDSAYSNTQVTELSSTSTTKDYRLLMAGRDGIIRVSAYVTPMGRSVVFFATASSYTDGNQTPFDSLIEDVSDSNAGEGTKEDTLSDSEDSADSAKKAIAEETGLITGEGNPTTQNSDIDELIKEAQENQAANDEKLKNENEVKAAQENNTKTIKTGSYIQVNRQFWLYLFLVMTASVITGGVILKLLFKVCANYKIEKKRKKDDESTEVK